MITSMEEPLPSWGACLLGSINLAEFVKNPFTNRAYMDYEELESAVVTAVTALNRVLIEGKKLHPLKEQQETVDNLRQIGLGTMGLGDLLIKMGIKYGSPESTDFIHHVYRTIAVASVETSLHLAKTLGCFPMCNKDLIAESSFIKALELPVKTIQEIKEYGLYNSQLLTCAPTGSISTMIRTSGGVEPNYAFEFNRRTVSLKEDEEVYKVYAKIVEDYREQTGNTKLPDYFISSEQVDPFDRLKVQAALQKYIDASISSTLNLKEEVTVQDVFDIYLKAWELGLKGITIYRNNCQRQAILSSGNDKKEEKKKEFLTNVPIRQVNNDCIGKKRTLTTGCGTLHLTAFFDKTTGQLLETYFSKGSTGGCANFMVGLSRMVSLAARAGVNIDAIIDQLKSAGTCPSYAVRRAVHKDTSIGSSCPVAIGNALKDMYNEMQQELNYCLGISESSKIEKQEESYNPKCPECGQPLNMREGCMTCPSCGYSKCG